MSIQTLNTRYTEASTERESFVTQNIRFIWNLSSRK